MVANSNIGHMFRIGSRLAIISGLLLTTSAAIAQVGTPTTAARMASGQRVQKPRGTVSVVLLSDIHFDPFLDPAKVPRLADAPVSEWKTILASLDSTEHQQNPAAIQAGCHTRGQDTSFALFEASLRAIHSKAAGASFVAVSGDLIAHEFPCKYSLVFAHAAPGKYRDFVGKTIDFVAGELRRALPGVPVYLALGNNDSDCEDYRVDARGEFLERTATTATRDLTPAEQKSAMASFADGGYYSATLPVPLQKTRLLVLDDVFLSNHYTSCGGKADPSAGEAQLNWLEQQLAEARQKQEKIWVMGHIPPGVNPHPVTKLLKVCGGKHAEMFLASERLAKVLADNSDVIQLALFGHTHMDELMLLKPEGDARSPGNSKGVAVKLIPSISPIHGNSPSFMTALVDPKTATMVDYRVFAAADVTGAGAWAEEYDFAKSYNKPEFSPTSLERLITAFRTDSSASTKLSQSYIYNLSAGGHMPFLAIFWSSYSCSLANYSASEFQRCACEHAP